MGDLSPAIRGGQTRLSAVLHVKHPRAAAVLHVKQSIPSQSRRSSRGFSSNAFSTVSRAFFTSSDCFEGSRTSR